MKRKPLIHLLCAAAAVVILASGLSIPVAAQGGGTLNPQENARRVEELRNRLTDAAPQPALTKKYPAWVGYLAIFIMVASILPLSLMPSKRSHQD